MEDFHLSDMSINGNSNSTPMVKNMGDISGSSTDGSGPDSRPLHIIIIGAGIGGLTAAIGLRRQGHRVTLLERSKFSQELGAAVHLAPNSNGVLRRYGIRAKEFGANLNQKFNEYNADGSHVKSIPHPAHLFQHVSLRVLI